MTPGHRALAAWLIARELGEDDDPSGLSDAVRRTNSKLCWRVSSLVTVGGYRALMIRAAHEARVEFPLLGPLEEPDPADGCVSLPLTEGLDQSSQREALTATLAGVIRLLNTFIGDELTLRIVRGVWPAAPRPTSPKQAEEIRR